MLQYVQISEFFDIKALEASENKEEEEGEKEEEEEVPQFEKWVAYGPAKCVFFVGFR